MQEDVRRRDAVIANLRQKMEGTQSQLNNSEEELARCSRELMARTLQLGDRTKEVLELHAQNDDVLADLELLRQDHAEAQAQIARFQQDVLVLAKVADQWEEQAHARTKALGKVRQELEARAEDLEGIRGEMAARVADVDQLRSWQTWGEEAETKQLRAELQAAAAERNMLASDLNMRCAGPGPASEDEYLVFLRARGACVLLAPLQPRCLQPRWTNGVGTPLRPGKHAVGRRRCRGSPRRLRA